MGPVHLTVSDLERSLAFYRDVLGLVALAHDDGRASIGITTMNKPDYCVRTLDALASDETVGDVLDRVYVVDQGTRLVRDREEFPALAERLGDRLEVIEQANLGGSGGFARSMLETVAAGSSVDSGASTPNSAATSSIIVVASSESPPSSKKSSWIPTGCRSSSRSHSSHSCTWARSRAGRYGVASAGRSSPCRGRAARSTFPFALSGMRSSIR